MPLFDYRCPHGHVTTKLRRADTSRRPIRCPDCGLSAPRLFPMPHIEVDGIYSHTPNLGDARRFEQRYYEGELTEPPT